MDGVENTHMGNELQAAKEMPLQIGITTRDCPGFSPTFETGMATRFKTETLKSVIHCAEKYS